MILSNSDAFQNLRCNTCNAVFFVLVLLQYFRILLCGKKFDSDQDVLFSGLYTPGFSDNCNKLSVYL